MGKKKIIIISIIAAILLIIALWIIGIIPVQIAKGYGIAYMMINFPEMQLRYENIEWSKYHSGYIIYFKDRENQNYSCVIGPKHFPVNIGQGIFAIEETYRQKYLGTW